MGGLIGGTAMGIFAYLQTGAAHMVAIYGFIAAVTGMCAGVLASLRVPALPQGLLVGMGAGLCAGLLNFWLLEPSFFRAVIPLLIGIASGMILFRLIRGRYSPGPLFAPPPRTDRA